MNRKIIVGFVIFAIGALLFVGYLPLIGVSAREMADDYDSRQFRSYDAGDRVTVYGTVTGVRYMSGETHLELDGDLSIAVSGNITGLVREGDEVYVRCYVDDINAPIIGNIEFLKANSDAVHHKLTLDIIFGIVALGGIIIAVAGVVKD